MRYKIHSYRHAEEILTNKKYRNAWSEIRGILESAPSFEYRGKSESNAGLHVVQQLLNTYFDRVFVVDKGWQYHPPATGIKGSALKADFRKQFAGLRIQTEVQFGNMSRWYSDIFKFQTAYSQSLIDFGLSVVPMAAFAQRIDSNVANHERAVRELEAAKFSITLPILLVGIEPSESTSVFDVTQCSFPTIKSITGKGMEANRYRIVHAAMTGTSMRRVTKASPTGTMAKDV